VRARLPRTLASALAASALLLAVLVLPAQASRGPTVTAALQSLQRSGQLSAAEYGRYSSLYIAARHSLGRLNGTRRSELGGVLANVQAIAAAGGFIASRLPALFLTLERNRLWWTTGPLLSPHQRVVVPGNHLIWEYYPGQGIEIQWLATFGKANGYYLSGHENANFGELLDEIIPLATHRAGGIAWEYMFQFDGGLPPWTSGLSQGTALQALSRGYQRLHEPAYLTAAQQALGIFQTPPPIGVRVATPAGAEYAEYTYAPRDRILNGFIQSLVGLYEYTSITKDPLGLELFTAGDAEARIETPHYDTGGWSLYDQYEESDLSYHELLAEFLLHLCQRTRNGPPLAPPATPPAGSTTTTSTSSTSVPPAASATDGSSAASGGASAARASTAAVTPPAHPPTPIPIPIPGDAIYCTTAQHFTADVHTPPAIVLLTKALHGGTRGGVQFSLSKVSTVSLTVRQGTHTVWSTGATVEGGKPRLLWVTPSKGGVYSITISAVDLAGNHGGANGTITVSASPHAHKAARAKA
jgi:hypothetical protein